MSAAARPPPPRPAAAASSGPPVSGGQPRGRDAKSGSISLGTRVMFAKDMWVWAPDPQEMFVPVKIVDQKGDKWRARDPKQPNKEYLLNGSEELCMESSMAGMADMINLEQLNEGAILHTIRTRFKKDQIHVTNNSPHHTTTTTDLITAQPNHSPLSMSCVLCYCLLGCRSLLQTYISTILMVVNPYQKFDIYGPAQRVAYQKRTESEPHAYALADNAYRGMREMQKSQSVVISGESGAGKTETTKIVLQYISFLSQEGGRHTIAKNTQNIEARILDCNPLMEGRYSLHTPPVLEHSITHLCLLCSCSVRCVAFGNAKTLRNNNSSRFVRTTQRGRVQSAEWSNDAAHHHY